METIPKARVIKWTIFTVVTPLAVGVLAAGFYITIWFMVMAMSGTPHKGPPPFSVMQRSFMLGVGVGEWFTVLLWWYLRRKEATFATLFNTRTNFFWEDFAIGLLLGGFWVIVYGAIGWPTFSDMFVINQAKLESLPASMSAGCCEEFLSRGFIILLIARAGGGRKAQILWSSLAFALTHILWGPIALFFTFVLGLSFAVVTTWRGNVWSAVIAHALLDICIEPALYVKAITFANQ